MPLPTETHTYELELSRPGVDSVTTVTITEDGEVDGGFDVTAMIADAARAAGFKVATFHTTTTRGRAAMYRGLTRA